MLEILAVTGVFVFLYSYFVYPLLLLVVAGFNQLCGDVAFVFGKADRRVERSAKLDFPRVAVVIAAFNEEKHIEERIKNLLDIDYPKDRIKFYIGSDGSVDATPEIMKRYFCFDDRLVLSVFQKNRGKASVLNELVSMSDQEIIVFSDANTFFQKDAIVELVKSFQDPAVGGVSGELRLRQGGGDNQDGIYWRIEQLLKFFEARIGGLLGANGAIYAIRRGYWRPLKSDTICDDFCVAMTVSAAGGRLVYAPRAWAIEEMPDEIGDEYKRRVRIGIGNFQALIRHPEYLTMTSWGTKFSYLSHKVARWVAPHAIVLSLFSSIPLAFQNTYWAVWLCLQVFGILFAAACYKLSNIGRTMPGFLKILAYLFALNFAFLIASWQFATGQYGGAWRRSSR